VPVETDIVREHLEKILKSAPFRASRRCQEFLRFVVSKSLDGHHEFLKERVIGAEVFGRNSSYEPSEDAIVRVKANEVRKRLAQYYMDAGASDPVRIEMPAGSYVAEFRFKPQAPSAVVVATVPPAPTMSAVAEVPQSGSWLWTLWLAVPIGIALAIFAFFPRPTALDQFWAPITSNSTMTMVCTGNSLGYTLSPRIQMEYYKKHPDMVDSSAKPIPVTADMDLRPDDIIPVNGDQVSVGTFYAALDISSLLQRKGKPVQVRAGCELATDDLSEHSFVLIGSFSNPWTMELSKDLRFSFKRELTADSVVSSIVDHESKKPANWKIEHSYAFGATNHDFAVVTRVIHNENDQVTISVAGLTRYGTQIAAEFVTNPVYWNEALKSAPKGWEKKNLQIVLETDVVGKTANSPRVLAMHFW